MASDLDPPERETQELRGTVICAVDATGSPEAVRVASRLTWELGLGLVLAHVAEVVVMRGAEGDDSPRAARARRETGRLLDDVAVRHGLDGLTVRRAEVGVAAEWLADIAAEENGVLIVVGARRGRLFRSAVRSRLADDLTVIAPCPVVVVPSPGRWISVAAPPTPSRFRRAQGVTTP